jgi:formate hydrogenlyase subunit 6/NADH:ubiquinone oxidoreductase subunit I
MLGAIYQILEQFVSPKSTNRFPAKYAPDDTAAFLKTGEIIPPVPLPENFRGRPGYSYEKCIGCGMCVKVCPAAVIELYPVMAKEKKSKRIIMRLARCTFCQECVDICPVDALWMEKDFMMADTDRNSDALTIGIVERRANELPPEPSAPAQVTTAAAE